MSDSELILKIGISMTHGVTAEVVRAMAEHDVGLEEFFTLGMLPLSERLGAGHSLHLESNARQEALFRARIEAEFMSRHGIRALFLGDEDYPPLLAEMTDAPVLIYVLGEGNLNPEHSLSIVGTRRATAYGLGFVDKFVEDLAAYYPGLSVISGLAYGVDASGHTAAMAHGLQTVAVVAHGLDMIYPSAHRDLARRIVASGGAILTEYPTHTRPWQRNFLERNRIVAGLSQATMVVESELRGGAMSTANQAFTNNRDVMALPGRAGDPMSRGCNHLIRTDKARLVTCAADVVELTGWAPYAMKSAPKQRNLFPELSGIPQCIYTELRRVNAPLSVDALHQNTGISVKDLMPALTEMEFDGIVTRLPGTRYELI